MKLTFLIPLFSIVFLLLPIKGFAAGQKLPVIDGKEVAAMVGDEPITLEEFNRSISSLHSEKADLDSGKAEERQAGKIDYAGILDRLITIKLIAIEARNIGLNELEEVKNLVAKYSRDTMMGILRGRYIKGVKADEEELDRIYQEAVKEFKINAVFFENEDAARKVEEEIKANGNFEAIIKRITADGTARGSGKGEYVKGLELLPELAKAASAMEIGSISPIVPIKIYNTYGYGVFKLEELRFPESTEAKEQARQKALKLKTDRELKEYGDFLLKKYVKVDEEVLSGIDYEASFGEFDNLLKDSRILAVIEGEQPLTAGEFTDEIMKKYFHGIGTLEKAKKLNEKKREFLFDNILQKRVLLKEALKQGIDRTEIYINMIREYENSILLDSFIKKVIIPDIKVDPEETKKYYNENIKNYSYPEMIRISSLVFSKRENADLVLERLKQGADFKWLGINAEGQVDKNTGGLIKFEDFRIRKDLPEGVKSALSDVKPGDFILYESPEKHYYVLNIQDILPPRPLPFEEIKEVVFRAIIKNKLTESLKSYTDKLREFHKVKIYLTEF